MSAALNYETSGFELVKRITGIEPKTLEMNLFGSGWCFFTDSEGRAYWLHVKSEVLLESARNYGEE